MTEVYFYHLEGLSLDRVLPDLLEKTLLRGWRAIIRFGSRGLRDRMNEHLWVYRPDFFLPHGLIEDGFLSYQPLILSCESSDRPDGYDLCFLVEGADLDIADKDLIESYTRLVLIFAGHDADELSWARDYYRRLKDGGYKMIYWQQDGSGGWKKSLEVGGD